MGILAQELQGVAFLLHGVGLVGGAVHLKGVGLNLAGLTFAHRFYQLSGDVNRGAGGNRFELLVGKFVHVEDNLKVLYRRSVVECYELHVFVAAAGAYPAFDIDFGADGVG